MAPYAPAPGRAPGCVPSASNRSRRRASCRSAGVSRAAKPVISDASRGPGMITGCLRRISPQTTRDQGSTDARGDGRDWCYWSERSRGRGAEFRSRFRPRFRPRFRKCVRGCPVADPDVEITHRHETITVNNQHVSRRLASSGIAPVISAGVTCLVECAPSGRLRQRV
jgi:hypothetical protein